MRELFIVSGNVGKVGKVGHVEDVETSELMSKMLVERAFSMVLGAPAFEALGAERAEVTAAGREEVCVRDAPVRAGVDLAVGCLHDGMDGFGGSLQGGFLRLPSASLQRRLHPGLRSACAPKCAIFLRLKY